MSEPAPQLADSSTQPAADLAPPEDFKPLCLDCRYDLSGLPDGKCPECGVKFTHEQLQRVHAARELANRDRYKFLLSVPLGLLAWLSPLAAVFVGAALEIPMRGMPNARWYVALLSSVLMHAVCAGIWFRIRRGVWIVDSYRVLGFAVPIVLMIPIVLETRLSWMACLGLTLYAAIFAYLALKWSPLVSGAILVVVCGIPPIVWGGAMLVDATMQLKAIHYWSNFDYPSPHGWRAMPATQCRDSAWGVMLFGVGIGVVISLFARRALVRLRRRA